MFSALLSLYQREGVYRGLFKGASLTILKGPITVAVTFACNDAVRNILRESDSAVSTTDSLVKSPKSVFLRKISKTLSSASGSTSFVPPLPGKTHIADSKTTIVKSDNFKSASPTGTVNNNTSSSTRVILTSTSDSVTTSTAASALDTNRLHPLESLLCGSIAGAVAKTVIAPGDRIKILYQINAERVFSWRAALKTAKHIHRDAGIPGY